MKNKPLIILTGCIISLTFEMGTVFGETNTTVAAEAAPSSIVTPADAAIMNANTAAANANAAAASASKAAADANAAVAKASATTNTPFVLDTNRLAKIIRWNLNENFDVSYHQSSLWSDYIAVEAAGGVTNVASLNTNLVKILNGLKWLPNKKDVPPVATKIALMAVKPAVNAADVWGKVWLWTGAKLQNAFTIDPDGKLNPNSTSNPYLEINLNERYVLRSGKWDDITMPWFGYGGDSQADSKAHWVDPLGKFPDIDGTFGYVFTSGNSPTNIATVVGNSDVYGNASVGFPIIRYCSLDYSWKQQVTLEVAGGFATDKNFLDVHPNVFLGGGYQGKFPNFINTTSAPIYWFGRVGAAMIDMPVLTKTVTTNGTITTVKRDAMGNPDFNSRWVPSIGTSVVVPITTALSFQAGANAYFSRPPANWNISLGVTLDLDKFASAIGTAFGLNEK